MSGNRGLTLNTRRFYGASTSGQSHTSQKHKRKCEKNRNDSFVRKWPRQLDPCASWKVFKKQQDALEYVRLHKNGLMAFAFQDKFGCRMFLAAHPIVFWFYDTKRSSQDRCSYEIIIEHAVCKLYFDLEFSKEHNCHHDGNRMTESFIKIVSFHLIKEWGISINRSNIIDLDSTTQKKFSRHLIFILPNAIFQDNYNVGNFVKYVCCQVRKYINENSNKNEFGTKNNLYDNVVDKLDVSELLVVDSKGVQKLFCDEGVYTKNRHFRLYQSTKLNKNSPLVVSKKCQYKIENNESYDLQLFLHSLITHVSVDTDNLRILKYELEDTEKQGLSVCTSRADRENFVSSCDTKSPYPEVDNFIRNLILPGRIYRWLYFSSGNHLVYDIIGYRYCGNIGRHHQSNNIKYVVNLTDYTYYQKCHDPDCASYRSAENKLPPELIFAIEDDSFLNEDNSSSFSTTLGHFGILEEDFVELVDAVECIENNLCEASSLCPSNFPDYGVSDEDMSLILENIDDRAFENAVQKM